MPVNTQYIEDDSKHFEPVSVQYQSYTEVALTRYEAAIYFRVPLLQPNPDFNIYCKYKNGEYIQS